MRIVRIHFEKLSKTEAYENERASVDVEVGPGDDVDKAFVLARKHVHKALGIEWVVVEKKTRRVERKVGTPKLSDDAYMAQGTEDYESPYDPSSGADDIPF